MMRGAAGQTEVQIGEHGAVYKSDRAGRFDVQDSHHVDLMKAAGMFVESGQPKTSKHFLCKLCGWDALIRSCPRCNRDDCLVRMMGDEVAE
jgi:hypothetical protein